MRVYTVNKAGLITHEVINTLVRCIPHVKAFQSELCNSSFVLHMVVFCLLPE